MDWVYGLIAACGVTILGGLIYLYKNLTKAYSDAASYKQKHEMEALRTSSVEKANEVENRVSGMPDDDVSKRLSENWKR